MRDLTGAQTTELPFAGIEPKRMPRFVACALILHTLVLVSGRLSERFDRDPRCVELSVIDLVAAPVPDTKPRQADRSVPAAPRQRKIVREEPSDKKAFVARAVTDAEHPSTGDKKAGSKPDSPSPSPLDYWPRDPAPHKAARVLLVRDGPEWGPIPGTGQLDGAGAGDRSGGGQGVAGGRRGGGLALRGRVCFVPEPTRSLSQIRRCEYAATVKTDRLDVAPRWFDRGFPGVVDRFEWFSIDYVGEFLVKTAGLYRFRLLSDDGSILWINGTKVIDNDGEHQPLSKWGSVRLDSGLHRIRVQYFQGWRTVVALQLFVTPPHAPERLFTTFVD